MSKLKLRAFVDDKPVKLSIELPASLHKDLQIYAALLGNEQGSEVLDPKKLVVPMLERFLASDRAFLKAKREAETSA